MKTIPSGLRKLTNLETFAIRDNDIIRKRFEIIDFNLSSGVSILPRHGIVRSIVV